jgi:hypothetical protein
MNPYQHCRRRWNFKRLLTFLRCLLAFLEQRTACRDSSKLSLGLFIKAIFGFIKLSEDFG